MPPQAGQPPREVAQSDGQTVREMRLHPPGSPFGQVRRHPVLCTAAVALVLALAALAVAYRHLHCRQLTDQEFDERLQTAIRRGTAWVGNRHDAFFGEEINVPIIHLLQQMNELHPTPQFGDMVQEVLDMPTRASFWKKLLDPSRRAWKYEILEHWGAQRLYQRWLIYTLDPPIVDLAPSDMRGLFDAERWQKRQLTHQLMALLILRRLYDDPRVTDHLVRRLCSRIAAESFYDPRMLDMSYQRILVLLMADAPELVRRRWVERIIEQQCPDGGWNDCWWGLSSMVHDHDPRLSDAHATAQALYALYLVRYADPVLALRQ